MRADAGVQSAPPRRRSRSASRLISRPARASRRASDRDSVATPPPSSRLVTVELAGETLGRPLPMAGPLRRLVAHIVATPSATQPSRGRLRSAGTAPSPESHRARFGVMPTLGPGRRGASRTDHRIRCTTTPRRDGCRRGFFRSRSQQQPGDLVQDTRVFDVAARHQAARVVPAVLRDGDRAQVQGHRTPLATTRFASMKVARSSSATRN